MNNLNLQENAVAAIRISSVKQGLQGDSPEAQKEQIERFAETHNIHIKKFFIFMESASKEQQPVQEAIDYCKNPKNDIQLFIIKSIDRFTRGGSYLYDHMKMQLTKYGVKLVDIYGIIGSQDVNTLEHLGLQYDWSVYSPTKKSEILEAERAKDEMRDIMSRMIGAEIRYVRMGYRVRIAPYGYKNEKVETEHGRRVILIPHPDEAPFILKMFDLKVQGSLSDDEIVKQINDMGFRSRKLLIRNPKNRTQVIGDKGNKKLTVKQYHDYIRNHIYAGVSREKWTQGKAIKCKFNGLVTIETFNLANTRKIYIHEENGEIKILKEKPEEWRQIKQVINPLYPYKKHVLCPVCKYRLQGSASRGKLGKYYPAYHCNRKGHYFRVPVKKFEETIKDFLNRIEITKEGLEKFKKAVLEEWNKRIGNNQNDLDLIDKKILELQETSNNIKKNLPYYSSPIAIKSIEEQLDKNEAEIIELKKNKKKKEQNKVSMELVLEMVEDYMEHLEKLVFSSDSLKGADYFRLLFKTTPTYDELVNGTPDLEPFVRLISNLSTPNSSNSLAVSRAGFEPATKSLKGSCSTAELPAQNS